MLMYMAYVYLGQKSDADLKHFQLKYNRLVVIGMHSIKLAI